MELKVLDQRNLTCLSVLNGSLIALLPGELLALMRCFSEIQENFVLKGLGCKIGTQRSE